MRISARADSYARLEQDTISPDLIEAGNEALARIARECNGERRPLFVQLYASQFYEAVRRELAGTPREEFRRRGVLAAAADQCRRSATTQLPPALMLVEIRAVVGMLASGDDPSAGTSQMRRPRLRLIQGGRV